jgi:hypothetical protein
MRIFIACFPYFLTMFLAMGVVRSFVPSVGRRSFLATSITTNTFDTWNGNGKGHQRLFSNNENTDNMNNMELEWTTDKVRSTFTSFFIDRYNHVYYPSSACAPLNDPTLLFTNAGMNQFKPIFLGQADPNSGSSLATLQRATNSQKCIRAGGKHNDLEDVGRDTYHHTFFEMLGSWSFGDYFKQEAIDMAWELLTKVYKLDSERIYATYFQGDENVPEDTEARDMWLKYLPADRVIGCDAQDNFWEVRTYRVVVCSLWMDGSMHGWMHSIYDM